MGDLRLGEIRLPIFQAKEKRWTVGYRRGRVFDVDGRSLELFPVHVLAETIGHSAQSIKRWERSKMFPAPMFKVPIVAKRATRWYSKVQIANIRAVYSQYPKKGQVEEFCRQVWPVFYKLEMTEEAKKGEVS